MTDAWFEIIALLRRLDAKPDEEYSLELRGRRADHAQSVMHTQARRMGLIVSTRSDRSKNTIRVTLIRRLSERKVPRGKPIFRQISPAGAP